MSQLVHFTLNAWPGKEEVPGNLKSYYFKRNELTVEEGCLLRGTRVVIPAKYQESVLAELHLNHPGIVRMKVLARLYVCWPTLDTNIKQLVRSCEICQDCKAPSTTDNPSDLATPSVAKSACKLLRSVPRWMFPGNHRC